MKFNITDLKSIETVAINFSKEIKPEIQIGLIGELGAGKTTFTSYLLKALGYEENISSPSYALCNEYQLSNFIIEHWDLYRLGGVPEELLEPPNSKTCRIIEWADKFEEIQNFLDLTISFTCNYDTNDRDLFINKK